jgi:hypothetical protein
MNSFGDQLGLEKSSFASSVMTSLNAHQSAGQVAPQKESLQRRKALLSNTDIKETDDRPL